MRVRLRALVVACGRLRAIASCRPFAIVGDRERSWALAVARGRSWALVGACGRLRAVARGRLRSIACNRPRAIASAHGRNRSWAIASAHGRPRSQSLVGDCERSQSLTVAIARGRLRALTVAHRHSLVFARGRLRALTSEKIKFDVASEKSVTVNIARRATYKRQRSTVIAHDRSWSLISDKDRDRYFRVDERRTFDYERPSSTTSAYSRLWSTIVAVSLAEKYRLGAQIGFTRQKYGFRQPFLGLFRLLRGDRVMFWEDMYFLWLIQLS